MNRRLLAKPLPYHRAPYNCRYDLQIIRGHLWGGWVLAPVLARSQIICWEDRGAIGAKMVDMLCIWEYFRFLITLE